MSKNLGKQMQNTLSAKVDKSIFADSSFSCLSNVFGQTTHLFQDPLLIISSNTKLFFDKYEKKHSCLLLYRVIYLLQGQVSLSPLQTITDPWLTINPIKCHLFCLHWTATTAISNSIVDKTLYLQFYCNAERRHAFSFTYLMTSRQVLTPDVQRKF